MKQKLQRINVYQRGKAHNCIITLPGRSQQGDGLARAYCAVTKFDNTIFIGLTPSYLRWYPMPRSPENQDEAIAGLPVARNLILRAVKAIKQKYGIPNERIVLAGFSAGGVMSINTAIHAESPFNAVVCHSGAILNAEELQDCPAHLTKMPILINHNNDDDCFNWEDRYLPMKCSLLGGGYNTFFYEDNMGGHKIYREDVVRTAVFLTQNGFEKPANFEERVLGQLVNKPHKLTYHSFSLACT